MDAIIIHFYSPIESVLSKAETIGIENETCYSKDGKHFYFRVYEDYESEYEPQEKIAIESLMGGQPSSSFALHCCHAYGRFALRKLIDLVELEDAIVDDDHGRLWNIAQLKKAYKASQNATIFNLGENKTVINNSK